MIHFLRIAATPTLGQALRQLATSAHASAYRRVPSRRPGHEFPTWRLHPATAKAIAPGPARRCRAGPRGSRRRRSAIRTAVRNGRHAAATFKSCRRPNAGTYMHVLGQQRLADVRANLQPAAWRLCHAATRAARRPPPPVGRNRVGAVMPSASRARRSPARQVRAKLLRNAADEASVRGGRFFHPPTRCGADAGADAEAAGQLWSANRVAKAANHSSINSGPNASHRSNSAATRCVSASERAEWRAGRRQARDQQRSEG